MLKRSPKMGEQNAGGRGAAVAVCGGEVVASRQRKGRGGQGFAAPVPPSALDGFQSCPGGWCRAGAPRTGCTGVSPGTSPPAPPKNAQVRMGMSFCV